MNKPLLSILGLVAMLGVAAWFVFGAANDLTPIDPQVAAVVDDATPGVTVAEAVAQKSTAEQAARRVAPLAGEVDDKADDPLFRASLAGFRGRLVAEGGEPAADKAVRIIRVDLEVIENPSVAAASALMKPQLEMYETRSATDGRFEVGGVWPQVMYLLVADHRGEHQLVHLIQRTPGPGQVVDLGDLVLPTLGTIVGHVVDEDGEPVQGAMVRAADVPGTLLNLAPVERFDPKGGLIIEEDGTRFAMSMPDWVMTAWDLLPIPTTDSGSDGAFTLRGVQPGSNIVVVNKAGMLPRISDGVRVKAGAEKDVGKLRLDEGEIAIGRVIDTADQPVTGAEVMVATRTPVLPVGFASFARPTDADGKFSLGGLANGRALVAVRRSPKDAWIIHSAASVTADLTVRLPARQSLTLAVKNRQGAMLDSVRFKMVCAPGTSDAGLDLGTIGVVPWIDMQSRVEKTEDGRYRINDIDPGHYSLAVLAEGYAAGMHDARVGAAPVEQEIVLGPAHKVQVLVLDDRDQPVRNAKVYLVNRGASGFRSRVQNIPIYVGKTGADGVASVTDAADGEIRVTASHPAFGTYHAKVELPRNGPVVIRVHKAGWITGILRDGGKPPTPGKFGVSVMRHWNMEHGALDTMPRLTMPDALGEFRVDGLAPGTYRVEAMPSLALIGSPGGVMKMALGAHMNPDGGELEVRSGAGAHLDLEVSGRREVTGPSARVTGTVLINGKAGKGMAITGWGNDQRLMAQVDDAGRFDLGQIGVGHFQISLERSGSASLGVDAVLDGKLWQFDGKIVADQNRQFDIHFDTGSLSGTVVDVDGAVAAGVEVRALGVLPPLPGDAKMRPSCRLESASDRFGRFTFPQVPAGVYKLVVSGAAGYGEVGDQTVKPALAVSGLRIQLERVYRISGKLDLSQYPDKPRHLYLRFNGPGTGRGTSVDIETGTFTVTGLRAGKFTIDVFNWGDTPQTFRQGRIDGGLEVSADLEDLELRPVFEPPKQPKK